MKILGIDPALTKLGWGVIESQASKIKYIDSGILTSSADQLMHKRLATIYGSLNTVVDLYKPDMVAMEETFINMNAASSLKLGYVRGAIMSLFGKYDMPFYEYKPNTIKKTVVGVGHADKEQIKHMMQIILSGTIKINTLDEADALAIAYTCSVNCTNEVIKL